MNGIPNLDYSALKKMLNKKAIETTEEDPGDRPIRRTPGVGMPPTSRGQQPGTLKSAMDLIKEEIESLQVKSDEAFKAKNKGYATELMDQKKALEALIEDTMENFEVQELIAKAQDELAANPMDPQVVKKWNQKIQNKVNDILEQEMYYRKLEIGVPLQDQLKRTVLREEYEKAPELQEKVTRLKTLDPRLVANRVISTMTVTAENLDLTEINMPNDEKEPVLPAGRKRNRMRFRNEPQGADEMMWEGMEGYRDNDKGVGTDSFHDVGCPASIMQASEKPKLKPIMRPEEVNMPNEKMERDTNEEKCVTDSWREFNDMQERF